MREEIKLNKYDSILLTQNECNYQKVMDDFKNATRINIVTFNFAAIDSNLIDELMNLNEDVQIKIITNIPKRFDKYFDKNKNKKNTHREAAKTMIEQYFNTINYLKKDHNVTALYNTKNHSKIIATDNIAYIGSANFSEHSERNYEVGFLTSKKETLLEIQKLIEKVEIESAPDIELKFLDELFDEYIHFHEDFIDIYDEFKERISESPDLITGKSEPFINYWDPKLKPSVIIQMSKKLEMIIQLINKSKKILGHFSFFDLLRINDVEELMRLIQPNSNIYNLAEFDKEKYIIADYNFNIHEIGDSSFDEYYPSAQQKADEKFDELMNFAINDLNTFDSKLKILKDSFNTLLERFTLQKGSYFQIDNTKHDF